MLASFWLPLIILASFGMYWPVHPSGMGDLEVGVSYEPHQAILGHSLRATGRDSPMEGSPLQSQQNQPLKHPKPS